MTLSANRLSRATREWSERLLDLLFPSRCVNCQRLAGPLCSVCSATAQRITVPTCPRCGFPLGSPSASCPNCNTYPFAITRIQSAYWHEGAIREAVHALKYNRRRDLALPLARGLAEVSFLEEKMDLITSVPLHLTRQRERGYNQAELLARHLARLRDLPYVTVLARTRATEQQVGLDGMQRRANVSNAFSAIPQPVTGKNVLLVDDVSTTGATLDACAQALFQANARTVYGLTVTRPRSML